MTTLTVGQLLAAAAICDCSGKGQGRKLAALALDELESLSRAVAAHLAGIPKDARVVVDLVTWRDGDRPDIATTAADLAEQRILDFEDPHQEWRRLVSELVGTFFLVLVAAGAPMVAHVYPGTVTQAAAVIAPGAMVMAMIMFMGKVSGAHFNPGVSMAFALRGDFPWVRVPGYVVAQLLGALGAAFFQAPNMGSKFLQCTQP